jgi:diaminopimelate epimerase
MGAPQLERSEIPMLGAAGKVINESLQIAGKDYRITSLLMGVPHTIVFIESLDEDELISIGKQIEKHPSFPKGTNVNFVTVMNDHEINVRTWERGAGRTLACGTGSCASAVASTLNGLTGNEVTVHLALGDLFIETIDGIVYMTGSANHVFAGEVDI